MLRKARRDWPRFHRQWLPDITNETERLRRDDGHNRVACHYGFTVAPVDGRDLRAALDADARAISHLLIGHASECDLDGNGRMLIPQGLREFAGLTRTKRRLEKRVREINAELAEPDWFHVASFPRAEFSSDQVRPDKSGYLAGRSAISELNK